MVSEAYVLINTEVGKEENVLKDVRSKKFVKEAYRTDRIYDIIARVSGKSLEDVTKGISGTEGIRSISGVMSTNTMVSEQGWKKDKSGKFRLKEYDISRLEKR